MIQSTRLWLVVSFVTVVACVVVIVVVRPLWGIDFTGGSLLMVRTDGVSSDPVRSLLEEEFKLPVAVQAGEGDTFLIRSVPLNEETHQRVVRRLIEKNLITEELRFESVGPTIGSELRRKALYAITLSVVLMVVYLAYIFRHAAGLVASWKFGVAATYALVHDVLVVTALFVILGKTHAVPVDTLFITALLSIFGYSVNDTIVIFNRFKQEWLATRSGSLLAVMDAAVRKSVMRSLNISLTVLLTLITLLLFGGSTLRWFIVALTAGTIVGTYSSFFVAPPFLYFLAKQR